MATPPNEYLYLCIKIPILVKETSPGVYAIEKQMATRSQFEIVGGGDEPLPPENTEKNADILQTKLHEYYFRQMWQKSNCMAAAATPPETDVEPPADEKIEDDISVAEIFSPPPPIEYIIPIVQKHVPSANKTFKNRHFKSNKISRRV